MSDEVKRLRELNQAIKAEQRKLVAAFVALDQLHNERGEMLYAAPAPSKGEVRDE